MYTLSSILKTLAQKIDRFDAELLLAHTLKKPREFILTYPEYKISWWQKRKFFSTVKKRASGIPIAYITGHKEFFGLDFFVNKYTLVPRPDTETLVESILSVLKRKQENSEICILDIGTGSGCIPIALAKNTQTKNIQFFASDISKGALKTAKQNAQKHNVAISFFEGSLLTPFLKTSSLLSYSQILLVANLPYLTQEQFDEEISIQKEPHSALVAEDQGLALYKELLKQIQQLIQTKKIKIISFFEIDPTQTQTLSKFIQDHFKNAEIEVIQDLAKSDRIIKTIFY
jgi:release factor glutamine methyltransferase